MSTLKEQADFFRKVTKLLEMCEKFGVDKPLVRYKGHGSLLFDLEQALRAIDYNNFEFPLGVIEGKLAWEGDVAYYYGSRYTLTEAYINGTPYDKWSWTPPKPKTVMVELTVEDAEEWLELANAYKVYGIYQNVANACEKALKNQ